MVKIAKLLSGLVNISMLINKWHLLQTEKLTSPTGRIDHYWQNIFEIRNAFGSFKIPNFTENRKKKICLSVSHFSADIEKCFSLSGCISSEDKTDISERILKQNFVVDFFKH